MRATLEQVLTEATYARTIPLAERFEAGVRAAIEELELPWNVTRLGCRREYWFRPQPARNGAEADIDEHTRVFREAVTALVGVSHPGRP